MRRIAVKDIQKTTFRWIHELCNYDKKLKIKESSEGGKNQPKGKTHYKLVITVSVLIMDIEAIIPLHSGVVMLRPASFYEKAQP